MDKIYTGYKCIRCKKELILITEEARETIARGKYIVCPYCSSRKILKDKEVNSLKELMGQNRQIYTRKNGAIRQK